MSKQDSKPEGDVADPAVVPFALENLEEDTSAGPGAEDAGAEDEQLQVEGVKNSEPVEVAAPPESPTALSHLDLTGHVISKTVLVFREHRVNSMSTAILQHRLNELGYGADSMSDLEGWYSHGVARAVEQWQVANGYEPDGRQLTGEQVEQLFEGTGIPVVA